ncbi:MAG: PilZ domain-containing protein [Rubrivivax sp.]|nr:PilZ domain-containing protein [Pyrinomonadaceae bacterium]
MRERMPELIRSIAGRLRQYVADRRRGPRLRVRLSVTVSLFDLQAATPWSKPIAGHTRDVSEDGLGLILPAIRVGDRYLVGQDQTLSIILKLPGGNARLYASPARYERLEAEQSDTGFLVGVRITSMDEKDRVLFSGYLESLKKERP